VTGIVAVVTGIVAVVTGIVPPDEGCRFGYNVTAWERACPDYLLQGSGDGIGLVVRRRNADGRASGSPIRARTLDGLAGQIDARPAPALVAAASGRGRTHRRMIVGRGRPGAR